MNDRMQKLRAMLETQPNDTFLLYGLAMEHKKLEQHDEAIALFDRTLAVDPDYAYAYYQKGVTLEDLARVDDARQAYLDGIRAAQRKGDAHAQSELQAALDVLG